MSQELERVYTIPLGKVLLSQSQHRAVRAINMIREFARKHMKTQEIKIEWVDPISNASDLVETNHQNPPDDLGDMAKSYSETMPAHAQPWWVENRK